jgi:hypothetical protein
MSNDHYDIDSVLFGGSDPPADGSFDPFLPGLGQEGSEDDGLYGEPNYADQSDDSDGVVRYGRFGSEGDEGLQPDYDGPPTWEGRTDKPAVGTDEQRLREAADAGIGHLRRVADARGGGSGTGAFRRDNPPRVANSIADAQQRIRELARVPITPDDERAIAVAAERGPEQRSKPKRTYEKQRISAPPQFQECKFIATLAGLKTNVAGTWTLTLSVPADDAAMFDLKNSYGLALNVHVERKRFTSDGDS